jgi:uncharacterized membrane protein YbhN (UPF0104 family)
MIPAHARVVPAAPTAASLNSIRPRRVFGLGLGAAISAAALYLALRGIDTGTLLRSLQSVRVIPLLLAIAIGASSNLVRALRWRALFPDDVAVRPRYYFTSLMIGYLGNNLLPARIGDAVRIVVFGRRTGVGISRTAATIIVERVIDALSLLALVAALSVVVPLPPVLRQGAKIAAICAVVTLVVLLVVAMRGPVRAPGDGSTASRGLHDIAARFVEGLHALRSWAAMLKTLFLTAAIWTIEAVTVWFVMKAAGLDLPPIAALFLLVVVSLGLLIPAGPAAVGSYELFVIVALSVFSIDKTRALSAGMVLHAMVFFTATSLGLISLWIESMSLRELFSDRNTWWREAAQ